jgi:hypothetical protein
MTGFWISTCISTVCAAALVLAIGRSRLILKYKAKQAMKYVTDYEERHHSDGAKTKCAWRHLRPCAPGRNSPGDGVVYLNCGDWVESCTALVEDFDGNIRLLHFHENNAQHTRRGPGSHDPGDSGEGDGREGRTSGDERGARRGTAPAGRPILCIGHEDADYEDIDA